MINTSFYIILITLLLFGGIASGGELYSYTDKKGVKHFSDTPPPDSVTEFTVKPIKESIPYKKEDNLLDTETTAPAKSSKYNQEQSPEYKAQMKKESEEVTEIFKDYLDAFGRGDLEGAVKHHTPGTRERYRKLYEDFGMKKTK